MSELFLVVFDWVDFGVKTMMLVILVQGYRKRHLVMRMVWWMGTRYRQLWIEQFIRTAQAAGSPNPIAQLQQVMEDLGEPLSEAELAEVQWVERPKH